MRPKEASLYSIGKPAIPALMKALKHKDGGVRAQALEVLTSLAHFGVMII
jgi:hypothetical protein